MTGNGFRNFSFMESNGEYFRRFIKKLVNSCRCSNIKNRCEEKAAWLQQIRMDYDRITTSCVVNSSFAVQVQEM